VSEPLLLNHVGDSDAKPAGFRPEVTKHACLKGSDVQKLTRRSDLLSRRPGVG